MTEIWPLIGFLFTEPESDEKAWKKVMKPAVAEPLAEAHRTLAELGDWDAAAIESSLRELMERLEIGARQVLQPIRVAISGSSISPGIFESLAALGRDRSLERIARAVERVRNDA